MEDNSEKKVVHFESSKKANSQDGWITPGGIFYGCTPEEHDECAKYLLQTHQIKIKETLEKSNDNNVHQVLEDMDKLNPRIILKSAGYALLSDGLLVEQNMPDSLSVKQLEFMQRSRLTFAPESGKLQPSVYLEFRERLKKEPGISDIEESLKHYDGGWNDNLGNFQSFIENPASYLYLQNISPKAAEEIYNLLTRGGAAETTFQGGYGGDRNIMKWRSIILPSGTEVFVQYNHHTHADYDADDEDSFALVSKKDIEEFKKNNSRF